LVVATLAEVWPDKPLDAFLDKALPDDFLFDALPEKKVPDLRVDLAAFSSYSHLSMQHLETLCPLHLQWEHFFPLSFFFFPLPKLFV
jgi:hypothetical protein